MTSQQFLVCDSSTLVNFKQWAKAISDFFATAGWVQTADTGQVNWTSIGAVPGSGAFVYEVWKPGDALTVFYVRIEYGNFSGTNSPCIKLSIGTGTNGAGLLTGYFTSAYTAANNVLTPPSTTTTYECNFSGSNNRMCVMMWRNATNNVQQMFAIERSLDSSGAYTGTYATLWLGGFKTTFNTSFGQHSVVFATGVPPGSIGGAGTSNTGGLIVRRMEVQNTGGTSAFNNSMPFDLCTPAIGYFDYPCTVVGSAYGSDLAEGITFTATVYGATRTYMPSKAGPFASAGPFNMIGSILCMRYD